MGDVDNGNLPMYLALNDFKRVDYLQHHIATLKESMEYENFQNLPLVYFILFAFMNRLADPFVILILLHLCMLCTCTFIYMWLTVQFNSNNDCLHCIRSCMQLGSKCARLLHLVSAGQLWMGHRQHPTFRTHLRWPQKQLQAHHEAISKVVSRVQWSCQEGWKWCSSHDIIMLN